MEGLKPQQFLTECDLRALQTIFVIDLPSSAPEEQGYVRIPRKCPRIRAPARGPVSRGILLLCDLDKMCCRCYSTIAELWSAVHVTRFSPLRSERFLTHNRFRFQCFDEYLYDYNLRALSSWDRDAASWALVFALPYGLQAKRRDQALEGTKVKREAFERKESQVMNTLDCVVRRVMGSGRTVMAWAATNRDLQSWGRALSVVRTCMAREVMMWSAREYFFLVGNVRNGSTSVSFAHRPIFAPRSDHNDLLSNASQYLNGPTKPIVVGQNAADVWPSVAIDESIDAGLECQKEQRLLSGEIAVQDAGEPCC
nr:hypothetical protein CFP56_04000 [Quercus suber]